MNENIIIGEDSPFCACSTPSGRSGIAVIRACGRNVLELSDKCIRIIRAAQENSCAALSHMGGYEAAYASLFDPDSKTEIDKVVVTAFRAPHSYTGDDMIEISCHGGTAVVNEILRVLYACGMRPALPGEFTKRAFVNGKLDLSESEAVMQVICAQSERALRAANSQLYGKLSARLNEIEDRLYNVMAQIEMIVEFPEHEDTPENEQQVASDIDSCLAAVRNLADSYGKGRILTTGMKVVLVGRPNSGKSTLLNTLAGYERAIVTEIPGTTRDTLEAAISIDGIPVMMTDTAGIRQTDDKVEEIGVRRAINAATDADMVLYLIDPGTTLIQAEELFSCANRSGGALIFTKCDLGSNPEAEQIAAKANAAGIEQIINISSKEEINIGGLRDIIVRVYENAGGVADDEVIIINERHSRLLRQAAEKLSQAKHAVDSQIGVDIASSVIRAALDDIGDITGKSVSSSVADKIFENFCIGK